jgi:hypothetical protein
MSAALRARGGMLRRSLSSCRRVSQMDLESASWQMVTLCLDPKRGFPLPDAPALCMHAERLVYAMVCACGCAKNVRDCMQNALARVRDTHIHTVWCNQRHALTRTCTPQTHAGVYKQTTYHKQTKNQWARDDPAFTGLCFKTRTHAQTHARVHARILSLSLNQSLTHSLTHSHTHSLVCDMQVFA